MLISDTARQHDFFGIFGIFDGYVNEDKTVSRREKSFTGNGKEGKYYLTGDKAKRDKEGYLWYVGRSDDVINSSGYRIGLFIGTKFPYFEN
jgi:acyl-coenzyme A synthetase/AMP-(fatty) acid ligase